MASRRQEDTETRQEFDTSSSGALDGVFWGLLFGLIFFVPLLGALLGAAVGGIAGAFRDLGIDDKFIDSVKVQVTEGTSAIFVLSENAVVERVAEAMKELPPHELIASNLTAEQEAHAAGRVRIVDHPGAQSCCLCPR